MSCAACSNRVEQCARRLSGAKNVEVNLLTGSMRIEYDEQQLTPGTIIEAITAAGYGAELAEKGAKLSTRRESTAIFRRMMLSLMFLIPLMMVHYAWHHSGAVWIEAAMLLPIVILNRKYFIVGTKTLLHGSPNMDTLIALGAASGIIYSIVDIAWLHGGVRYLESAGMILTLITFGKWLEARATGKTGAALEKLRALLPEKATILKDGKAHTIAAADICPGDILFARPGERIAADGDVVEGHSDIDESALTGESMPSAKEPGSHVYAGTMNGCGSLQIRATSTRAESSLSDIIRMVGEAAAGKAPIARLADIISGIFVPLVVLAAIITAAAWLCIGKEPSFALGNAISVLVISCPCALGLATPVAIMVGAGKGAERGIIFRNGEVLENARNATAIILDKTGTITTGSPVVTDIHPIHSTREELLLIAASLETAANHPIAQAIILASQNIPVQETQDFIYHPGRGVTATIDGKICAAGNAMLMRDLGIELEKTIEISRMAAQGKTPLFIARDKQLLGIIAVADSLKEDSPTAIAAFRKDGLRVIMMTGDNEQTANAIAAKVGIDEVLAGVMPRDKAGMVQRLQAEGLQVAMVGDGINDAPALTQANVGIAIGNGTDVAIESAGIILMRNGLMDAAAAMHLSKAVIRNIRQNLFWAFFYNILTIPLAAGVYYPLFGWQLTPGIAAAAMSLSSFCVVCNALRLKSLVLPQYISETDEITNMNTTITINIEGMMCPHCERHMTEAFMALPGVISCKADHKAHAAALELCEPPDEAALKAAVDKAGYTWKGIQS